MPNGLLVGGSDRGVISMYDVHKLIKGEKSLGKIKSKCWKSREKKTTLLFCLVFSEDKHTGPVAALDFNPFQQNLLASGKVDSGSLGLFLDRPSGRHFISWSMSNVDLV